MRKSCPTCGRYANRGLTVDAIIQKNDKILLIKRGNEPFKGLWALPGGFVGWNETVEETLRRETKEETGLEVKSYKLIGIYSKSERHPQQVINIAYAVETRGKPKAGDDALELCFFSIDRLPNKLACDHREIISNCLSSIHTD